MASVIERVPPEDKSTFWDFKGQDAMVDSWFLMRSPVPMLLILTAYFLVIAVGPRLMKNRSPMKLNTLIMIYNAFQILISGSLVIMIFRYNVFKDGFLLGGCQYPTYTRDLAILSGTWVYFIAKITELLDTVFFVLRKKDRQITFLHVYHHASMVVYMWSYLKYAAAGDGAVLAFLNCFIHVVMYSYYLLSGLGPKLQKFLWWKKYVTEMQLVQFLLMLIYLVYTHFSPKCKFSTFFNGFIGTNVTIYLVLFLDFYYKSYKNKKSKV